MPNLYSPEWTSFSKPDALASGDLARRSQSAHGVDASSLLSTKHSGLSTSLRLAILSDTRVPTLGSGGHGLGRVAWDVAAELASRGHDVTLYAGPDSIAPSGVHLVTHADEITRTIAADAHDAWLDFSHHHHLSYLNPDLPVVNYISDSECSYQPPNACVCTGADQADYPNAALVPLGIDVKRIPFNGGKRGDYLAFLAKIIPHKGVDLTLYLQAHMSRPIIFAGERMMGIDLPCYAGELDGDETYQFLGAASGLLQLARIGTGGGRIQLEAAACGTPTLCLADNGTQEHVAHTVSGYICADLVTMLRRINDLSLLSPICMRQWVTETHSIEIMTDSLESLISRVINGDRW